MTAIEKFCESLPKGVFKSDLHLYEFYELDDIAKRQRYHDYIDSKLIFNKKDDIYYFGQAISSIKRVGRNLFKTSGFRTYIVFRKNKIKIRDKQYLSYFFEFAGINWIRDINPIVNSLISNSVLQDIITGKCYSEETLIKSIAKHRFGIKNVNWRLLRDYFYGKTNKWISFSIIDLKCFTKNLEQSIEVLSKAQFRQATLISDLIRNAIVLNEVVDLTWSEKRMNLEHERQNSILLQYKLDKLDSTLIVESPIVYNNIKQLNTECEIYTEAQLFHNCLYNCYFPSIKHGNYIAFHLDAKESCVFGVKKVNNEVILDQAKYKYNKSVDDQTLKTIMDFIELYQEQLLKMFNDTKSGVCFPTFVNDDLPY